MVSVAAPSLNLTPDEKRLYSQLFRQADTGSAGIVTGDVAVTFFEKTRLDSRVLGEVGLTNLNNPSKFFFGLTTSILRIDLANRR